MKRKRAGEWIAVAVILILALAAIEFEVWFVKEILGCDLPTWAKILIIWR